MQIVEYVQILQKYFKWSKNIRHKKMIKGIQIIVIILIMKNSEQLIIYKSNKPKTIENQQQNHDIDQVQPLEELSNLSKSNLRKTKYKQRSIVCDISDTKYPIVKYVCKKIMKFTLQNNPDLSGWDLKWTDNAVQPQQLSSMQQHQKINHFPGMYNLSRKNYLGRNLMKMRKKFPQEYNFFPLTWMLPSEYGQFKSYYQKNKKSKVYIVKPEASSQGRGIFLTKDIEQIVYGQHYVVQRYIQKPFLIDNLKFDFRIYVLLAGCSPLRIYLYSEGLTRFATEKYSQPNKQNIQQVCMHLTNYAINKQNQNFIYNQSESQLNMGHKRSLTAVLKLLQQQGHNVKQLWNNIKDLLIKTFISAQPVLAHHYISCQPQNFANNMCFELLGIDIMLDEKLKPNLLEVNYTPSFTTDTPLDKLIKKNVITDTLKLMNINNKSKNEIINSNKQILIRRVLTGKKQRMTAEQKLQEVKKAQIKRDQWENKNLGDFQRIYPSQHTDHYQEFLSYAQSCYEFLTGANIRRNNKKQKSMQFTEVKKQTTNEELQKIYKQKLPVPKNNIRKSNFSAMKQTGNTQISELQQTRNKLEAIDQIKQTHKIKNESFSKKTINNHPSSQKQFYNPLKIFNRQKDPVNYIRPKISEINPYTKTRNE